MSTVEEFSDEPKRLLEQLLQQPSALFHPQRLAIMTEVYYAGAVEFPQLKHDLKLTDGALATYLRTLSSQGLIEPRREQVGPRAKTTFIITKRGISALERLFQNLQGIGETFKR